MDTSPESVLKYCQKCGNNNLDFNANHSLTCNNCDFIFFLNSAAAVAGLIKDKEGKLLLTLRKHDPCKEMLDLPGGFIDIMESAENAISREIHEELNLKVNNANYLTSFPNKYVYGGLTYHTLDIAFICEVDDFSTIKPADDVQDYMFIEPGKIDIREIAFSSTRKIISHYISSTS